MNVPKVLVAGGAGYIGSVLVRTLAEAGREVQVWDDLSTGHRAAVPAHLLREVRVGDRAAMRAALADFAPDVVMHLCARSLVGESVRRPAEYWRHNVADGLALVETLLDTGRPVRFVFSGTAAAYGVPARVPITEDAAPAPINPYGRTKVAFEWLLGDLAASDADLRFVTLRYFNAAGAWPDGSLGEDHRPETHLIPLALQTALGRRAELAIFGTDYDTPDGTCLRDYVHVRDLADAHLAAAARLLDGGASATLNLGTGHGYSVREVLETARRVTGCPIPAREEGRRPGDPPRLVASGDAAGRLLGWRPRSPDLDTIIAHAWAWHRAHPEGYGG